jgi:cation diffusion facilitator CzcD-associated flavoprotein CzcO
MGGPSRLMVTAAAVGAGLAGLAAAGRLLAPGIDTGSPATSTVGGVVSTPPVSIDTSIMREEVLVPRAVGRTRSP